MGLTSGGMTFTRYLLDPLREGEQTRDRLVEQVRAHAFGVNPKLNTPDLQVGLVSCLDPLDTNLDFQKLFYTNFIAFSYREDSKRIPAGTFRVYLKQEMEKEMAARNRQRLAKNEKEEIRDGLRERLLVQAIPDIKIYDVLWFHAKGELLFFGSARPVVERFRKLFRHALERELLGRNHFTALRRMEGLPADIESQVLALAPSRSLVAGVGGAAQEEWEDGPRHEE